MNKATAEWVKKAEADRVIARKSSQNETPLHDGVCFHCQQCVEKYLKGLIEELAISVPKTHDLERLLEMLLPVHPSLKSLRRGLAFLTTFAVATRYPGEDANKRQAISALRWMDRARNSARGLLGLPTL